MKRALAALAILAVLAAAAAVAALVQPGGRAAAPQVHPLRIGVSLGLTGRYAAMAEQQEQGFRLWVRQQNAAGGLDGRPVELLARDDAGDPQAAQEHYRDFIQRRRVDFLFAPYSSELTEAVSPLAGRHGYPLLSSGAAADSLWDAGNPLLFGMFNPASRDAQGFLELLVQQGLDRLAILCFPGLFPAETCRGARAWAGRLGLDTVCARELDGSAPDLDAAVAEARAAGAEVLLVCGYARDAAAARRAVAAAGWRPRAVFATIGPGLEGYGEDLGALAEGVFSSSLWEPELPYPGAAEFTRDFAAAYGRRPSYPAAAAYAAGQLLAQAVAQAGGAERRRVAETLAGLDTVTILGRYALDRRGMQTRHLTVLVQWQAGRKAVVWPRDLATAEPRFP